MPLSKQIKLQRNQSYKAAEVFKIPRFCICVPHIGFNGLLVVI